MGKGEMRNTRYYLGEEADGNERLMDGLARKGRWVTGLVGMEGKLEEC